jgi:hypothetical protein
MSRRIFTAYLAECLKALRWKYTFLGPVLVVAAVACAPLMHPLAHDGRQDYAFIAYATPMALNLLGLVLLLTYCAGLVSGEMASGVLRFVCVRPILRHELLLAKLLLGLTYAATLMVLVAATSWAVAALFGNVSGVEYGGEVLFTGSQMAVSYVGGMALSLAPLGAAVAYALFISTLTRSSGAAIGAALGLWLFADAVKYPLGIAPLLFSTYIEMPWQVFTSRCSGVEAAWTPAAYYGLATSLISAALFVGAAITVFDRRNLQA